MALLDFFNSPNAALAAGLLSPNQGGSFGTSLLGGIEASQASRQNNTQDQLAQLRGQLMQNEALAGPLAGSMAPMSVKEFEYYQTLPVDQQNVFMQLKRDQWKNLGGGYGRIDGNEVGGYIPKSLTPGERPETRADQTTATMEATKAVNMKGLTEILDQADLLLSGDDAPTGSGIGTAADQAAGYFGITLPGGEKAAQLKSLQAAAIIKMPRMEGPQSDKDAQTYREQAALIGDSTIPVKQRIAALKTIRMLNEKYRTKDSSGGTFDSDKERRYQEWKAKQ